MDKNRIISSPKEIVYSLVIPCYNESENLENLVDRCKYLLNEKEDVEVVIVDNGSTDNSSEMLKDLLKNFKKERLRSIRIEKNQGYGYGILIGLNECIGDILGWTHADLQADPVDFLNAISLINQAQDSNRVFIKGKRLGRPLRDVFFTWGMSIFERLILGVHLRDINAQPTVFSKEFFISLQQPPTDFSIDLYFYYEAVKRNYNIKRFSVKFGLRLKGQGHNDKLISKIKYSWKTIIFSLGLRRYIKNN
jgi:glycosyltransferase involved in cell wall biosynthesis